MTHVATHCGFAGTPTGTKTIKIDTGSVLNYAVHMDEQGMRDYGIPEWAISEFQEWLWQWRGQLVEKLVHMGIPYTYNIPHPENFDP